MNIGTNLLNKMVYYLQKATVISNILPEPIVRNETFGVGELWPN